MERRHASDIRLAQGEQTGTSFRWGVDTPLDEVAGFSFEGETERLFLRRAKVGFPTFERRLSRLMKTTFRYQLFAVEQHKCFGGSERIIKPVAWLPGTDTRSRVRDGLDVCKPADIGRGFEPGGNYTRDQFAAQTYRVTVGGRLAFTHASLATRSGFDKTTSIRYDFGKRRSPHRVCGPTDAAGRSTSADTAPRVLAGTFRTK